MVDYEKLRLALVNDLKKRGVIKSQKVYDAMKKVPREEFIPVKSLKSQAYIDSPQRIGKGQTISAPHMNAMMCEYLDLKKGQKVLEVGTGSGYHAALLAEIVGEKGKIISLERIEKLADNARNVFSRLEYNNIEVIVCDGSLGYEEGAPYDRILVTAASPTMNQNLINQLSGKGGKMCIPVGKKRWDQKLYVVEKNQGEINKDIVCSVVFVPLVGEFGF